MPLFSDEFRFPAMHISLFSDVFRLLAMPLFQRLEIEKLLSIHGKSLKDFPEMPTANFEAFNVISNRLIQEELSYDCMDQEKENQELVRQLTEEQNFIYNEVLTDIDRKAGGLFFVYGYRGTGKTFLWRALSSALRSKREIVLNVASSGIASLLLPGGRTAHSRFVIPISVNEDSTCNISHGSPLAELIVQSKLIIWDEAPMMHNFCFEALDRTMMDLLRFKNPNITVPEHLLLKCEDDPIATIVDNIFPHFRLGIGDLSYLNDSAILAPTLDVVDSTNQYMNDHNPAEGRTYLKQILFVSQNQVLIC
ncbi:PREDICTED: uncharacterized protein LOC109158394 [Ipomoea nil]|uniref:uncharacterized protein LOC109158394 n=1 Tax=Ipomoea nil TaxID=35883 RepID=UPI000900FA48|nr:PREDICTED: uncharacterized protein LOC109158394 [Ipomoea nil]